MFLLASMLVKTAELSWPLAILLGGLYILGYLLFRYLIVSEWIEAQTQPHE